MGVTKYGWRSAGTTHVGKIRDHNEDAYLELPEQNLWLVADGMGGHEDGQIASRMIVDSLQQYQRSKYLGTNVRQITERLQSVNRALVKRAGSDSSRVIGSTVAVLIADGHHCVCLWAGDSRVYRYRNGIFKQLTRDHNHENKMIDDGASVELTRSTPGTQALTRAVGAEKKLELESQISEVQPEDIYLLCSDGLNKELSDIEIAKTLSCRLSLAESVRRLEIQALEKGGRDNITTVLTQLNAIC